MNTKLASVFVQIVTRQRLYQSNVRGEKSGYTTQELLWHLGHDLRSLQVLHKAGTRFDYQAALDAFGARAARATTTEEAASALFDCMELLESMAVFNGCAELRECFEERGLTEWLGAQADRYSVNVAVTSFLRALEEKIEDQVLLEKRELVQALHLSEFFGIRPLPLLADLISASQAVGLLPTTEQTLLRAAM